jgi:hypothetical protein
MGERRRPHLVSLLVLFHPAAILTALTAPEMHA